MKKFHDTKVRKNSFHFNNYEPNQPIKSKQQSLFRDRRPHLISHQNKELSKKQKYNIACWKCMLNLEHHDCISHKYIRIGGGYRHSYWYIKAILDKMIDLEVRIKKPTNHDRLHNIYKLTKHDPKSIKIHIRTRTFSGKKIFKTLNVKKSDYKKLKKHPKNSNKIFKSYFKKQMPQLGFWPVDYILPNNDTEFGGTKTVDNLKIKSNKKNDKNDDKKIVKYFNLTPFNQITEKKELMNENIYEKDLLNEYFDVNSFSGSSIFNLTEFTPLEFNKSKDINDINQEINHQHFFKSTTLSNAMKKLQKKIFSLKKGNETVNQTEIQDSDKKFSQIWEMDDKIDELIHHKSVGKIIKSTNDTCTENKSDKLYFDDENKLSDQIHREKHIFTIKNYKNEEKEKIQIQNNQKIRVNFKSKEILKEDNKKEFQKIDENENFNKNKNGFKKLNEIKKVHGNKNINEGEIENGAEKLKEIKVKNKDEDETEKEKETQKLIEIETETEIYKKVHRFSIRSKHSISEKRLSIASANNINLNILEDLNNLNEAELNSIKYRKKSIQEKFDFTQKIKAKYETSVKEQEIDKENEHGQEDVELDAQDTEQIQLKSMRVTSPKDIDRPNTHKSSVVISSTNAFSYETKNAITSNVIASNTKKSDKLKNKTENIFKQFENVNDSVQETKKMSENKFTVNMNNTEKGKRLADLKSIQFNIINESENEINTQSDFVESSSSQINESKILTKNDTSEKKVSKRLRYMKKKFTVKNNSISDESTSRLNRENRDSKIISKNDIDNIYNEISANNAIKNDQEKIIDTTNLINSKNKPSNRVTFKIDVDNNSPSVSDSSNKKTKKSKNRRKKRNVYKKKLEKVKHKSSVDTLSLSESNYSFGDNVDKQYLDNDGSNYTVRKKKLVKFKTPSIGLAHENWKKSEKSKLIRDEKVTLSKQVPEKDSHLTNNEKEKFTNVDKPFRDIQRKSTQKNQDFSSFLQTDVKKQEDKLPKRKMSRSRRRQKIGKKEFIEPKKILEISKISNEKLMELGIDKTNMDEKEIALKLKKHFGKDIHIQAAGKTIATKTFSECSDANTNDLANDSDLDLDTLQGHKRTRILLKRGGDSLIKHMQNVILNAQLVESNDSIPYENKDIEFVNHYQLVEPNKIYSYARAFVVEDYDMDSLIDGDRVKEAVLSVPSVGEISEKQMNYISSILGFEDTTKLTFRMFAVMVAVAERVTQMDSYCKKLLEISDTVDIQRKMVLYRSLFYCNLEYQTDKNYISSQILKIELIAGGLNYDQQKYVINRLTQNIYNEISFIDYLTYIPLFLSLHDKMCINPLNIIENMYTDRPPSPLQRDQNPLTEKLIKNSNFQKKHLNKKKSKKQLDLIVKKNNQKKE
ncbi:hypothetical protein A3Q56_05779 [Intoshia linei]|uniref:Uncharacterized protein n=1 Tax=Intoshia linei TaxID=1819745 RepID=A0A177AXA3_9BILA|nr:hypothetical protein A3Q56_05779 [Intoshia linei]